MSKDIRICEEEFFSFIKLVKDFVTNSDRNDDKYEILSYIDYHMELRKVMTEKDLYFEFYKANNSPVALENYKKLKERHQELKETDKWRFNGKSEV